MSFRDPPARLDLGYHFHPRRDPSDPGHPRLDVVLRPAPTQRHFDPERIRFSVVSDRQGIEFLTVHHPWRGWPGRRYRVCAGRVTWWDRKEKAIGALTLGGDLRVESTEACTTCVLISPAPIIRLVSGFSIPTLLALEMETLFAERRAAWIHDLEALDRRLAAADPHLLYRACLTALEEKTKDLAKTVALARIRHILRLLHTETRRTLESEEPALRTPNVPSLTELL